MDYLKGLYQGLENRPIQNSDDNPAIISGTNIAEPVEEIDLSKLITGINRENIKVQQKQDTESALKLQEVKEADQKARKEALTRLLAQKAEEEKAIREEIHAKEDAIALEMEEKKQVNPFTKLVNLTSFTKQKNDFAEEKNDSLKAGTEKTKNLNTEEKEKPRKPFLNIKKLKDQKGETEISSEEKLNFTVEQSLEESSVINEPLTTEEETKEEPEKKKTEIIEDMKSDAKTIISEEKKIFSHPLEKPFLKKEKKTMIFGFTAKEKDIKDISERKENLKKEEDVSKKKDSLKKKEKKSNASSPNFEYLATHDKLTGLYNRTGYEMKLEKASSTNLSVLFVDINNLKRTNDTFGHEKGDKLINTVAKKLSELFPDNVYRLGGDEFVVLTEDTSEVLINKKIAILRNYLEQKTKNSTDGVIYAVAVGYATPDTTKTIQELQDIADKAMYEDKTAYKQRHPELDARTEKNESSEIEHCDYDSLLSTEQRELKTIIRDAHEEADEDKTERIIEELQMRYTEARAVLITDADFNTLYIIRDPKTFVDMLSNMQEEQNMFDYTYFYVLYEGGPQYYGADDYYTEITHIFEGIADYLLQNRIISQKELAKIPGVNIFKNIYFD